MSHVTFLLISDWLFADQCGDRISAFSSLAGNSNWCKVCFAIKKQRIGGNYGVGVVVSVFFSFHSIKNLGNLSLALAR